MKPQAFMNPTPVPSAAVIPTSEQALMVMLDRMEILSELYKSELDALELRDIKAFGDIQAEKNGLIQDCEEKMKIIKQQPEYLKTVSSALKERIYVAERELRALAEKSQIACQVRVDSAKRLQERLLEAARQSISKNKAKYNREGREAMANTRPVATAINEAI